MTGTNYQRFLAQSAMALGLAVALAGCGQGGDAQTVQSAETASTTEAVASTPAVDAAAQPATEQEPAQATIPAQGPVVASLGNVTVSQREVQRFLGAVPKEQQAALTQDRSALERWLRGRLAEKALAAQARAQDWHQKPEIRDAAQEAETQIIIRSYLQSVSVPDAQYPSEQELEAAYEANQAQFQVPELYRVRQIFLSAPNEDAQALARQTKQAESFVKQLRDGKADFAKLAVEHSDATASAQRGGDNGYLPLAQLVPELRAVVTQLKPGQVSDPIVLPEGLHILKLEDVRAATVRPLTDVRGPLRDALRAQRQQETARAYLEGMLDTDTVSIDGKVLSTLLEDVQAQSKNSEPVSKEGPSS